MGARGRQQLKTDVKRVHHPHRDHVDAPHDVTAYPARIGHHQHVLDAAGGDRGKYAEYTTADQIRNLAPCMSAPSAKCQISFWAARQTCAPAAVITTRDKPRSPDKPA